MKRNLQVFSPIPSQTQAISETTEQNRITLCRKSKSTTFPTIALEWNGSAKQYTRSAKSSASREVVALHFLKTKVARLR